MFDNIENKPSPAHQVKNPEGKQIIKHRHYNRQTYFYYLLSVQVPVRFHVIIQYIYVVRFILISYNNYIFYVTGSISINAPVILRPI